MNEKELRAFQRWIGRFRTASATIRENEALAAMNGERSWLAFINEGKPVECNTCTNQADPSTGLCKPCLEREKAETKRQRQSAATKNVVGA